MIILVGLGNPGEQYKNTRHNIGFEIIDSIHDYFSFPKFKSKFDGLYSRKKLFENNVIIFKPQSFMNLSGSPIMQLRNFFRADNLNDLILIHDDFDVSFLNIKIKSKGGHGGHNGVKDTIKYNGEFFHRIKLGIRNSKSLEKNIKADNFVLENFSEYEKKVIGKMKESFNLNLKFLIDKNFSLFKKNFQEKINGI